eukprot:scaffold21959_cov28-Cyclotella_meneghiniana.AAC.1
MKYREAKRLEDEMTLIKYRVARRKENALMKKLAQRVEEAAGYTTAVRFLMQYLPMKLLRPHKTYILDPPDHNGWFHVVLNLAASIGSCRSLCSRYYPDILLAVPFAAAPNTDDVRICVSRYCGIGFLFSCTVCVEE